MTFPRDISTQEVNIMENLLQTVQDVIHVRNPFVRDFKQIIEIPEEELEGGKIVISADDRPQEGHARVYNAQANLQELRIVTNEKKHDLVIQCRGGGLQRISDLNPKAMPLHYTLLFIDGTYGWDQYLTHRDNQNKRVSTREFYAYHMNIRLS